MGSSGVDLSKGIDPSVHALVWVRRRNGSWWPGRILGPDELPEGCVPTPRSGTPVKLLGREDASVDWYNLEKSKRVKAFRCGEYNDCIEKAKASASSLSKKAVKYARREDAILHALELESLHLGVDRLDFSARADTLDGKQQHHIDKSSSPLHSSKDTEDSEEDTDKEELSSSEDDSDSAPELSQYGVSYEDQDHVDAIREESEKWRNPNDSEDDGTEGIKRMRGLEDLGMGVATSFKRKRSQVAHVHEFLKKKSRHRTLTKVLECSTKMVSVPVGCEQMSSPAGSSVPETLESNKSKKNNSLVTNKNSDSTGVSCENADISKHASDASFKSKMKGNEISCVVASPGNESSEKLFDVPLVAAEKNCTDLPPIGSGPPQKTQVGVGALSSQSSHVRTISLGKEEHNETGSTSSGSADVHKISQRIEKGTSEWQLKGKRNSRSRKLDTDEEEYVGPTNRASGSRSSNGGGFHVKSRPVPEIQVEEFRGWNWNAPPHIESLARGSGSGSTADVVAPQRLLPHRQSRFTVNPKYDSSDFSLRHHIVPSGLYDVTLEVKTSYRPQRVPYISLMSKLHGQPIVGHPLTVEVLEDGVCDDIVDFSECYRSSSELEYISNSISYDPTSGGRPPSKHRSLARHSLTRSSKSWRTNVLLSKKIRKLSSLTGSHRQNQNSKKPVVEKLKGPSLACVPLKVVFSRINAALSSSARPVPRLAATSIP